MLEILPDKFTPIDQTLMGRSAAILIVLSEKSYTVSGLYFVVKERIDLLTFESFSVSLAFLYAAELIDYNNKILGVR